jgi:hypothetical protein
MSADIDGVTQLTLRSHHRKQKWYLIASSAAVAGRIGDG